MLHKSRVQTASGKWGALAFKETLRSTGRLIIISPLLYLATENPTEPDLCSQVHPVNSPKKLLIEKRLFYLPWGNPSVLRLRYWHHLKAWEYSWRAFCTSGLWCLVVLYTHFGSWPSFCVIGDCFKQYWGRSIMYRVYICVRVCV